MLTLVFDENFNHDVIRALLRANPRIEVIRVQDVGLSGVNDEAILGQPKETAFLSPKT